MKIFFGYVDERTELDIYNNYLQINENLQQLQQVLSMQDILQLQVAAAKVYIHPEIVQAVVNIVRATRGHNDIVLGASTRSGIAFIKCLKAFALVRGRDFIVEDDVQAIARSVIEHRLIFRNKEVKRTAFSQILDAEMQRLNQLKLH
jgi:MoxR-like ATPases